MLKPAKPDTALIVGSGVIGLSLAWELAQRGQQVRVLDSGNVGRGASWAGAGILPPSSNVSVSDPYEQLRALSHEMHPVWAKRLQEVTGMDTGFRRCGGIYLARSSAELATLVANQFWWDEHEIVYERWTANQLVEQEPALEQVAESVKSAWFSPEEYQLRNPWHLAALASACQAAGVELIEQTGVDDLVIHDGQVLGVESQGRQFAARKVCICSGAWARMLLERLGVPTGIMPIRGQMILYKGATPPINRIVNDGNRYLVPREDGHVLAGSVEEEAGYRCETTEEAIQQIRQWAEGVLPILKEFEVQDSWAGLRPGSFDGFPYLGHLPGTQGLYVAAGHFRSGLHLSCATAVAMAELMTGNPSPIDLRPFRPARG